MIRMTNAKIHYVANASIDSFNRGVCAAIRGIVQIVDICMQLHCHHYYYYYYKEKSKMIADQIIIFSRIHRHTLHIIVKHVYIFWQCMRRSWLMALIWIFLWYRRTMQVSSSIKTFSSILHHQNIFFLHGCMFDGYFFLSIHQSQNV